MAESAPGAHNMLQMCLKRIAVRCGALQCSIVLRSVMQCAVEVCNFMAESLLLGHRIFCGSYTICYSSYTIFCVAPISWRCSAPGPQNMLQQLRCKYVAVY